MDPGPLTLRDLVLMADARRRDEWSRFSNLLCLLANVNRDPRKTKAFTPQDFFPFAAEKVKAPEATAVDKAAMAMMFGGSKIKKGK